MDSHEDAPLRLDRRDVDTEGQGWGSDVIADLLKGLGFHFVSYNPGASFRGIGDSIVNYNHNVPEVIGCPHEELAVSIAHGQARATDEPALCILHDTVGTLHGTMNLYRAYSENIPLLIIAGNGPLRKSSRRPWIEWIHTVHSHGGLIGEYVKWWDQPADIDGVAESIVRGFKIANTPPKGPVFVTIDVDIQEGELEAPIGMPPFEKFEPPSKQAPDRPSIDAAVELLHAAESPAIVADRFGKSRDAVASLVRLAETLGAPVIDSSSNYFNFPNTHPLSIRGTELLDEADVILSLDIESYQKSIGRPRDGSFELIDIGTHDLEVSSLTTEYASHYEIDLPILADTEVAVPTLADEIEQRFLDDPDVTERTESRFKRIGERHRAQRDQWRSEVEEQWSNDTISIQRLTGELWETIQDERWVVVNGRFRGWPLKIWEIDEYDQWVGGKGVGYGMGGAIGGALAYAHTDRIPINLIGDGDLMYYLNGFWLMSHYGLPILTVVHNNKSYYNSTRHRMRVAESRARDSSFSRALIGTGLCDPVPDYAHVAEGLGVNGYGPIEDPDRLRPALKAAWNDVMEGEPAVVDVISEPR